MLNILETDVPNAQDYKKYNAFGDDLSASDTSFTVDAATPWDDYNVYDTEGKIISTYDIDYIHNKLYQKQLKLCEKLNFTPSDSVWLSTTLDIRFHKFRRNKTNRICLAGVINEET